MLKVDVYIKIVLTVIAVCLMVIAFGPVDVNIAEIGDQRLRGLRAPRISPALPVEVINTVDVVGVR